MVGCTCRSAATSTGVFSPRYIPRTTSALNWAEYDSLMPLGFRVDLRLACPVLGSNIGLQVDRRAVQRFPCVESWSACEASRWCQSGVPTSMRRTLSLTRVDVSLISSNTHDVLRWSGRVPFFAVYVQWWLETASHHCTALSHTRSAAHRHVCRKKAINADALACRLHPLHHPARRIVSTGAMMHGMVAAPEFSRIRRLRP